MMVAILLPRILSILLPGILDIMFNYRDTLFSYKINNSLNNQPKSTD